MKRLLLPLCLLAAVLLTATACRDKKSTPEKEDYGALFPFKGIDKPEISYGDLRRQQCNPHRFTDPGVKPNGEPRIYTVDLQWEYKKSTGGQVPNFKLYYVDASRQRVELRCGDHLASTELHVSLELRSGQPFYLAVEGTGAQDSEVKARISGRSKDGLVVLPDLSYHFNQTKEGEHQIPGYCEYVILP